MRRLAPALVLSLIIASLAYARDAKVVSPPRVSVSGEKIYQPYEKIILKAADFPYKSPQFAWEIEGTGKLDYVVVNGNGSVHVWAEPGTYTVRLDAVSWDDRKIAKTKYVFRVAGKVDPDKPDDPVVPPPNGGKPPIDGPGFRVLILEEKADRATLPKEQILIIQGKEVRDYLNTHTIKDKDNPSGAYRIWDKDDDASSQPAWNSAVERAKKHPQFKTPWILISNGKTGWQGPLPDTRTKMMELMRKYTPLSGK